MCIDYRSPWTKIACAALAICCAFCLFTQPIKVNALAIESVIGGVVAAYFAATGIQLLTDAFPADDAGNYLYGQFLDFCADKGQQISDLIDVSQLLIYNGYLKIKKSISDVLEEFTDWFVDEQNITVDTTIFSDVSDTIVLTHQGINYNFKVRDYTGVPFSNVPLLYNLNDDIFPANATKDSIRSSINNSNNYYVINDSNGNPVLYLYIFWQYLTNNPNANLYTYWATPDQFRLNAWTVGCSAESRYNPSISYNNCDFNVYTSDGYLYLKAYFNNYYLMGGGYNIPKTQPSVNSADYQVYMFFHHSETVSQSIQATADPVYPEVGDDDNVYLRLDGVTPPTTVDNFADAALQATVDNTISVTTEVAASDADIGKIPDPELPDFPHAAFDGVWHYVVHLFGQAAAGISFFGDLISCVPDRIMFCLYGVAVLVIFGGVMSKLLL